MESEINEIESELQVNAQRVADLQVRLNAAREQAHETAIAQIALVIERNDIDRKAVIAAISPAKRKRAPKASHLEAIQGEPKATEPTATAATE